LSGFVVSEHGVKAVVVSNHGGRQRAVLVGRPVLWGLCAAGEQGASRVLEILRRELDEAMLLCGCEKLADIP
jgi:isopentenyl diphosphate isomerase/L-lactate dehydrogenase-like FMN-dependent dehydrogenase